MSQAQRSFFGSHPVTRGTAHALKVAATTLSAGAATISILTFARAAGLLSRAPDPAPERMTAVAWMGILPQADTARSIEDTIQLTATLKDEHGALITGAPSWSSDDPLVAVVDSAGAVVARGEGSTTIVAAAGGRVARARIAVRPAVAAVEIQFDSSYRIPEGEGKPAIARPLDARGHSISGWEAAWISSDTMVVTVDSTGMVTGHMPGRAFVEGQVRGIAARIEVAVIPVAGSAAVLAGKGQHGLAGHALTQPLVVQVLSRGGRPMDGVPVRFAAEETVLTDGAGRARYAWELGDRPGQQHLTIAVAGLDTSFTVHAEADPVPSNTRVQLANALSPAPAGDSLRAPVIVNVTDSLGNPLADIPVTWLALDGGKALRLAERTDSLGQTRGTWVLGPKAGRQQLRVQVGDARGVAPLTLNANAEPGAPYALVVAGGAGQTANVGTALKLPVAVRVVDRHGNRIRGQRVVLRPESGTVPDSTLSTDSLGQVSARWTLGRTAGSQKLRMRVEGVDSALVVAASANPLGPASLSFAGVPSEGTAFHALPPVRVILKDAYGNPLAGQSVGFTATVGKVDPARVKTDAKGVASTRWTLGTKPGLQSLVASIKGAAPRDTLTIKAVKAPRAPS